MNIHELAGSVYHTHYPSHVVSLPHTGQHAAENIQSAEKTQLQEFSDILSNYMEDSDDEELLSAIEELTNSIETLKTENYDDLNHNDDVMSILTDQEKAKEYLSSQPGTELIIGMVENSIAGLISGAEN